MIHFVSYKKYIDHRERANEGNAVKMLNIPDISTKFKMCVIIQLNCLLQFFQGTGYGILNLNYENPAC